MLFDITNEFIHAAFSENVAIAFGVAEAKAGQKKDETKKDETAENEDEEVEEKTEVVKGKGKVLIHCAAGVSRR